MSKNIKLGLAVLAIVIIAGVTIFSFGSKSGSVASGYGVPTVFDNVNLLGSLVTGVSTGNPTVSPNTNYSAGTVYAAGDLIQGGLCTITATASSTASIQLTSANLGCTTLVVNTASTTGTLTLVLPASSTMTSLANIGDESDTYVYAASTTGNNIVIAATTTAGYSISSPIGIASTTAASTTIQAGKIGILFSTRLPTTNIYGVVVPTL